MKIAAKVGNSFFKIILGIIVISVVFVFKFISSIGRYGAESNKVAQINNLLDSGLGAGTAQADVSSCSCTCNTCGCGQCSGS